MSFATGVADDYDLLDGIESVTVEGHSNVKAFKSQLTDREIMAAGYEPTDVAWRLWESTMGTHVPKQGEVITDSDGDDWGILSVATSQIGNVVITYRCACRKRL